MVDEGTGDAGIFVMSSLLASPPPPGSLRIIYVSLVLSAIIRGVDDAPSIALMAMA